MRRKAGGVCWENIRRRAEHLRTQCTLSWDLQQTSSSWGSYFFKADSAQEKQVLSPSLQHPLSLWDQISNPLPQLLLGVCGWWTRKAVRKGAGCYLLPQHVFFFFPWGPEFSAKHTANFMVSMKVKVLVAQSCLTLYDPMDCSSPGSFVHGIP